MMNILYGFRRYAYHSFLCLLFVLCVSDISAQNHKKLEFSTIVIDAGHGGKDPGCISLDKKTYEKEITLDVAKRFGAKIKENYPDVKVIYTRTTDTYVTLNGRAEIANRNNANLFVSIHVNSAGSTQANGFSSHILGNGKHDLVSANKELCKRENSVILLEEDYTTKYQGFDPNDHESFIFFNLMQNAFYEQSLLYAASVNTEMSKGPIRRNRGISQDPFLVLWKTTMPSVLIEIGFISNASDLKTMRSSAGRNEIAQRLFNAFRNFKATYDKSVDYSGDKPVLTDRAHSSDEQEAPAVPAVSRGYGVQVFVLSRFLKSGDHAFKGYDVTPYKSGHLYKYIIRADSAEQARNLHKQVADKFPGSFPVRIDNGVISRL